MTPARICQHVTDYVDSVETDPAGRVWFKDAFDAGSVPRRAAFDRIEYLRETFSPMGLEIVATGNDAGSCWGMVRVIEEEK